MNLIDFCDFVCFSNLGFFFLLDLLSLFFSEIHEPLLLLVHIRFFFTSMGGMKLFVGYKLHIDIGWWLSLLKDFFLQMLMETVFWSFEMSQQVNESVSKL